MPTFEPTTKRMIIASILLFLLSIILFFTVSVYSGNLDGNDVVKIIDAISGIFKKTQLK